MLQTDQMGDQVKNELDSRFILSVFETIRTRGKAEDNAYLLDGLKAYTDFDGYRAPNG